MLREGSPAGGKMPSGHVLAITRMSEAGGSDYTLATRIMVGSAEQVFARAQLVCGALTLLDQVGRMQPVVTRDPIGIAD